MSAPFEGGSVDSKIRNKFPMIQKCTWKEKIHICHKSSLKVNNLNRTTQLSLLAHIYEQQIKLKGKASKSKLDLQKSP